jgi:hypothetical protein
MKLLRWWKQRDTLLHREFWRLETIPPLQEGLEGMAAGHCLVVAGVAVEEVRVGFLSARARFLRSLLLLREREARWLSSTANCSHLTQDSYAGRFATPFGFSFGTNQNGPRSDPCLTRKS